MNNSCMVKKENILIYIRYLILRKLLFKIKSKQDHLGDEEQVNLDFDLNENPSRTTRVPIVDFTMRMDGTISSGDGEYNPHKVISQSRMRYESLLSQISSCYSSYEY